MSEHLPDALKRKWRADLARRERDLIDARSRARNEKEYQYTHGYEPESGTWLVPLDWLPRRLEVVGPIDWVEYVSRKKFEGPKTYIFHHDHEIEHRPWLARGRNDYNEVAYAVLGGGYTITAHGIEDDPTDRRDIPMKSTFRVPRTLPNSIVGMGKAFGIGYRIGKRNSADRQSSWTWQSRELDLSDSGLVLAYRRGRNAQLYFVPER